MNRTSLIAIALALATPALGQPAAGFRYEAFNTPVASGGDLLPANTLKVNPAGSSKTMTTFSATVSLVGTASKVIVTRTQGATTRESYLNFGEEVAVGTDTELFFRAVSGTTYNLRVETSTTWTITIAEVQAAVSIAGRPRSSSGGGGSGDVTGLAENGDAIELADAGGPVPTISAHQTLENIVATWIVTENDGNLELPNELAVITSATIGFDCRARSYTTPSTALADLSLSFIDGGVQTFTAATDVTLTTTINSLPPDGTASAITVIVTSTGGGSVTYPSAWAWLGTKVTSLTAGQRLCLQLIATSNEESSIVACSTVIGTGS